MPRVYTGRLSYNVREKDIQRFFSGYGCLLKVDVKNRYGFVEFQGPRDAHDAVYEWNRTEVCGERVTVERARGPRRDRDGYGYGSRSGASGCSRRRPSEYRLTVENLSSRCSWQDLKDFMRQAGEVTYADAHKERKNESVIEFRSGSDRKRALDKPDGTEINGRNIRLIEDSRSRSRSRRRSRSRSRRSSRSRSRSISKSRSQFQVAEQRSVTFSIKRSKSKSKPKSDRGSHSHFRSRSKDEYEKSRSRSWSRSPKENGKGGIKSKSISRSQSRSISPQPVQPSKARSVSPPPKRATSRSRSRSRSKSRSRTRSSSRG
uniref:RRM domain-containing protein n=1 Tax=Saimiri boliviensis boliviensis TaxID=39432 RepID=A0A2K6UVC3_SAIBB